MGKKNKEKIKKIFKLILRMKETIINFICGKRKNYSDDNGIEVNKVENEKLNQHQVKEKKIYYTKLMGNKPKNSEKNVQSSIKGKDLSKTYDSSKRKYQKQKVILQNPKSVLEAITQHPEYINRSNKEIKIEELRAFVEARMKRKISIREIERILLDIADFNDDFSKVRFKYDNDSDLSYIKKLIAKKKNGEFLDGFEEEYLREYKADNATNLCWSCMYSDRCFEKNKRACAKYRKEEMSASKYREKYYNKKFH